MIMDEDHHVTCFFNGSWFFFQEVWYDVIVAILGIQVASQTFSEENQRDP